MGDKITKGMRLSNCLKISIFAGIIWAIRCSWMRWKPDDEVQN
jgi:hypothetical protein